MHRRVSEDKEGAGDNAKSNDVGPQCLVLKAERAQDGCSGHLHIQPPFVFGQRQSENLVDQEAFEGVVED